MATASLFVLELKFSMFLSFEIFRQIPSRENFESTYDLSYFHVGKIKRIFLQF